MWSSLALVQQVLEHFLIGRPFKPLMPLEEGNCLLDCLLIQYHLLHILDQTHMRRVYLHWFESLPRKIKHISHLSGKRRQLTSAKYSRMGSLFLRYSYSMRSFWLRGLDIDNDESVSKLPKSIALVEPALVVYGCDGLLLIISSCDSDNDCYDDESESSWWAEVAVVTKGWFACTSATFVTTLSVC